jgi:hypothetical protein
MSVQLVQIVLAVVLFFVINWIGEHSLSFGYLKLGLRVREDSAPAFNFLLKALAPTVYVILIATAFYAFHRDRFTHGIWLLAAYYFVFRLLYNLLLGRARLLNWFSTLTQAAMGVGGAYLAYVYLVIPRKPLLPGAESVGNQLWIIVALFLYAVFNNVRTASTKTVRRKNKYLRSRIDNLRKTYGSLVDKQFPERYMELVAYAVLIYETFNRPALVRFAERLVFPWASRTLGPMQVRTATRLSDRESVAVGTQQLREAFEATKTELHDRPASRYQVIRLALAKYNRDENYIGEVLDVLHTLWAQVTPEYRNEFETMYPSVV